MGLTYRELIREARGLANAVRHASQTHKKLAGAMDEGAKDTGRIAEQIAALHVDTATVAETNQVGQIMRGMSTAAIAYANAADEATRAAVAAEQQTITDHGGIKQAADKSPVPMADRRWYTKE